MANYLIIGGSSGIGKALAKQLANDNHQVFATYNQHPTESASIQYHPLNVLSDSLDLGFVPETLDGIAYCPGSINLKPFHRIKPTAFVEDFELQVVGAIKVIQALLPNLKKSTQASILFFSTVAVQTGFNFHTQVAASKGAIEGLTKALAAELAPTIRVNCIAPSLTDTPLAGNLLNTDAKREANANRNPMKKVGTPEDIANIAAYLLGEKSNWVTGQILSIDGGMSTLKV